jgi:outer membrane biosynthesis protein TonB
MMRYALATPPPVFPKNRFSRPDDVVVIQATISPNGAVTATRTLSGPPDLRPAVTQAIQAWHFKPYVVDGNPVPVVTTFNFAFKTK